MDENTPTVAATQPDGTVSAVPRINGKWKGSFFRTDELGSTPVTATIRQDRDAITISTDLPADIGANFTGSINSKGKLTLTDGFDGEVWTTFFGPATTNFVKIADFIVGPTAADPEQPLKVIELRR
ncbi:MAG: hypothetical protein ACI9QL_004874 [Candidatus Omnitrophota bacterium]|jgi:hypothetical protein